MTNDDRWNYTWDAENRLAKVESRPDTPQGSWRRVEWTYDAEGRRIGQKTSLWTNSTWVVVEDLKFVSDPLLFGRHIAELNATNNALVRSYVWGLDLSGTMDGAGGVGGLLWVGVGSAVPSGPQAQFCAYDGNGNVVALVHASDGSETARYDYGPFGELIRVTGPAARSNPFRFSTKRTDNTTDFVLYEYRLYSPTTGRWPSRHPIGELGHEALRGMSVNRRGWNIGNLYGFVHNNPTENIDTDGREIGAICGRCGQYYVGECPRCGRQPPGDDVDYPWYVDVFGAVCDIGSADSICFDIATFPSGEGAVATVCLQACKQSVKNRIKAKIACDLLYSRIHGNPRGTDACDKPQACHGTGKPMGWYLERAANALECSALRTAWLKKCACKGLKNKKWHGMDWEEHWRQAGIAAANFAICINKARETGWKGDVPTIPQ